MSLINSTKSNASSTSTHLNSPQSKRLSENKSDFRRSAIMAALAFVAVGSISYIGLQKITAAPAAPVVQAAETPPDAALLLALELLLERERVAMRESAVEVGAATAPVTLAATTPIAAPAAIPAAADEHNTNATDVATAPDCYEQVVDAAREATIFFNVGSATLTPADTPKLRELGSLVADCPEALVHVTGHSDASGNDIVNMTLSWQRADNIVAAVSNLGLDASRFEAVGFGARSPLSQGDASEEDLNRRVEFMIVRNHH
jgi:outer membrane protein OmpA-like peptidoglycan-associated protein